MVEETPENQTSHTGRVRSRRRAYTPSLPLEREDALDWLHMEVQAVSREAQLRIQDAAEFATEYARGRMSRKEYEKRWDEYRKRWSEPLQGLLDSKGQSDEEITKRIDAEPESGWSR